VSESESSDGLLTEPLDPERHDRQAFASGNDQVDNFLKRTANKLSQAGNLRTFVKSGAGDEILGFYAINASAIDYRDLLKRFARGRPAHGQIPVAFIAMIGVDVGCQGQGLGSLLLADALKRIVRASQDLGIAAAILDVLDCGDPRRIERRTALYLRCGFEPLPSLPLRLFLPVMSIPGATTRH
jgi:GNAT superfamily N-acetyltransferase